MFSLLHLDPQLLAVDKPAGLTVIPGRDEALSDSLRGQLEQARGEPLWVVHRLDRDTSGVVLFARDAQTHRLLNQLFETRQVRKSYRALAAGAPLPEHTRIDLPLHGARKGRMRPALPGETGALSAQTGLRVLRRRALPGGQELAEVELSPHTGRQHQLRVHLRALGAPLVGDPLYRLPEGKRPQLPASAGLPSRLALHAWRIAFVHPHSGQALQIEAPLPAGWRDWLDVGSGRASSL